MVADHRSYFVHSDEALTVGVKIMAQQRTNTPDESHNGLPREIGNPARQALSLAGYTQLEALNGVSARYLLGLHGVGPKAIRLLQAALAAKGLALAE
jgi:hypothetical protein